MTGAIPTLPEPDYTATRVWTIRVPFVESRFANARDATQVETSNRAM